MVYLNKELDTWKDKFIKLNREFHSTQEELMMVQAEFDAFKRRNVVQVKVRGGGGYGLGNDSDEAKVREGELDVEVGQPGAAGEERGVITLSGYIHNRLLLLEYGSVCVQDSELGLDGVHQHVVHQLLVLHQLIVRNVSRLQ